MGNSCQFKMLSQGNNVSLGTEKIGTDKAGGRTSQRRGYTCTFKNFLLKRCAVKLNIVLCSSDSSYK